MAINWDRAGQGQNALAYFQLGQQMGQSIIDSKINRALGRVLTSPSGVPQPGQTPGAPQMTPGATPGAQTPGAPTPGIGDQVNRDKMATGPDYNGADWQTLARYNPQLFAQLKQQNDEKLKEQQKAKLISAAAGGDKAALLSLWGVDYNAAKGLDEISQKRALDSINYITNAAFDIIKLPPEQRAAAWDAYVQQGMAAYPGLAQYRGKYSPESLNSIVAQAGKMQEFQTYQQPKYSPVGENGLAGFQYGVPIQNNGKPQNFGPQPQPGDVAEGAIAVNKSTGQQLIFRGGKWEPYGGGQPGGTAPFGG